MEERKGIEDSRHPTTRHPTTDDDDKPLKSWVPLRLQFPTQFDMPLRSLPGEITLLSHNLARPVKKCRQLDIRDLPKEIVSPFDFESVVEGEDR